MVTKESGSAANADTFDTLRQWLQSGGSHLGPVSIGTDATLRSHRRLEATAPLAPSTPFIRIPPSHLITSKRARSSPHVVAVQSKAAADGLSGQLPNTAEDSAYLLLFLLAELCKGSESFWRPWFDSLPQTFVTPLTAPEPAVARRLAGTPVLPLVHMLRTELRELYDTWFIPYAVTPHGDVYNRHFCTFERFLYAHAVFESRAFKIDEQTVLAPFADMANHTARSSPTCNSRVRGWATDDAPNNVGLELYVATDGAPVATGDELCISYGALANWQLLLHFGFVPQGGDNPDDGVVFELDGDADDETDTQAGMRRMIILQVVCGGEDSVFMLRVDDPLPKELVRCARVLLLQGDEMDAGVRRDYDVMVSPRNERAVIERLRVVVETLADECEVVVDDTDADDGGGGKEELDTNQLWRYCRVYAESVLRIMRRAHEHIDMLEKAIPKVVPPKG